MRAADPIWVWRGRTGPRSFAGAPSRPAIPDKSWTQASTAGPSQCAELSPEMDEGAHPSRDEPLTCCNSAWDRTCVPTLRPAGRYAAFGFLPGAGAGTLPRDPALATPRSSCCLRSASNWQHHHLTGKRLSSASSFRTVTKARASRRRSRGRAADRASSGTVGRLALCVSLEVSPTARRNHAAAIARKGRSKGPTPSRSRPFTCW